jgi:hypothetical protein
MLRPADRSLGSTLANYSTLFPVHGSLILVGAIECPKLDICSGIPNVRGRLPGDENRDNRRWWPRQGSR